MPKILYYILFVLFAFTTSTRCSGVTAIADLPAHSEWVCKKEPKEITKQLHFAEKYKEKTNFKKRKYIKTRYMKGEVRFILSPFIVVHAKIFRYIARHHFLYRAHFSSDHHRLAKQRGPPSFLS